jgi:hypothetical protein
MDDHCLVVRSGFDRRLAIDGGARLSLGAEVRVRGVGRRHSYSNLALGSGAQSWLPALGLAKVSITVDGSTMPFAAERAHVIWK